MITVNKFQISADRKQIDVEVSASLGETIIQAILWTDETYGVELSGIDLSAKLTGIGPDYSFSILPEDVAITSFDGIYFMKFTESEPEVVVLCNPVISVVVAASSFIQFFYCINNMLCNIERDCVDCDYNLQNILLADLFLEGMKNALMIGRFTDAVNFLNSLRKICNTTCDTCCGPNTTAYGFGVLNNNFILS